MDWRFGGLNRLACDGWIEELVFKPCLMFASIECGVPKGVLHETLADSTIHNPIKTIHTFVSLPARQRFLLSGSLQVNMYTVVQSFQQSRRGPDSKDNTRSWHQYSPLTWTEDKPLALRLYC